MRRRITSDELHLERDSNGVAQSQLPSSDLVHLTSAAGSGRHTRIGRGQPCWAWLPQPFKYVVTAHARVLAS
jgi:hypothetical protein